MYLFLLQKNIHHLVYVYVPHNKFRYVSFLINHSTSSYIPIKIFYDKSLSKEDCLAMCKEHNKNVTNKTKQPLTEDQIKQNEENERGKDLCYS